MEINEFLKRVNDDIEFLKNNGYDINEELISEMKSKNDFIIDNFMKPFKYEIKTLCLNNIKKFTADADSNDVYRKSDLYFSAFYLCYYLEMYDKSYLKYNERNPLKTLLRVRDELASEAYSFKNLEENIIEVIFCYGEALMYIALLNEPIDIKYVTNLFNYIIGKLDEIKASYEHKQPTSVNLGVQSYNPLTIDIAERHYRVIDLIDEIKEEVTDDLSQIIDFDYIQ